MRPFLYQLRMTLLLHARNRMAIVYSYLFPTIFLIAFWVLYRHERVPLARHMGELLTVTALGGACFGLPTTMVSERERGVWRRYRLAPVRTGALLATTVVARYVLLVLAGLLQVALAMLVGMPVPNHPFDLWIAFTCVAFALLGLGLVIAALADNVPAVQALGQCIFLPMLIIGGVAVQLASLPEWAQRLSSFFPGRYAVEAMQAAVTGPGLPSVWFSILALVLIGAAACLAGARLFRWDAQQRFAATGGKGWVVVALAAWVAVGVLAETRGREPDRVAAAPAEPAGPPAAVPRADIPLPPASPPAQEPAASPAEPVPSPPLPAAPARTDDADAAPNAAPPPASGKADPTDVEPGPPPPSPKPAPEPADSGPPPPGAPAGAPVPPKSWQDVTPAHIDEVMFERLPADSGVVAPIAPAGEALDPDIAEELDEVRMRLVTWPPGRVADPVQRVRNLLYVAAVPDVFQLPVERYLPHVVFEHLQAEVPAADLSRILFWVATHAGEGDDSALDELRSAGLRVSGPSDVESARERVMLYALKLLGRVTGRIPVS